MRRLAQLLGAGALVVVGAVHLNLWAGPAAYRHIPTVGPLFLFNAVFSFVLAAVVLVRPGPLVSAVAAAFSFATMGGYALSLSVGLFGFFEPGISYSGDTAIAAEALAGLVFLAWLAADLRGSFRRGPSAAVRPEGPRRDPDRETPPPFRT